MRVHVKIGITDYISIICDVMHVFNDYIVNACLITISSNCALHNLTPLFAPFHRSEIRHQHGLLYLSVSAFASCVGILPHHTPWYHGNLTSCGGDVTAFPVTPFTRSLFFVLNTHTHTHTQEQSVSKHHILSLSIQIYFSFMTFTNVFFQCRVLLILS